ncbi:MAG: hypothetical protein GOU98_03515 [Candidatus Altiarchaeota archaeon]|nr:hypothetical protein [Candidatus Altiarchaeota archaeon]
MMGKLVKTLLFIGLLAGLGLLLPLSVRAIGGTTNDTYTAETFVPINGSISTTAGTIYTFNLSTQDKTYRWVGLWGNITGSVQLKTASNTFYSWVASTVTDGSVVFATTDASGVDPTDFVGTNVTYLNQADTQYDYVNTVIDSITNTYTGVNTFQSPSMQSAITVNSTGVGAWTNNFVKKIATDLTSTDDIVWAVDVLANQQGFNGQYFDYQLLIPENEESGDADEGVATTYYLWIELN